MTADKSSAFSRTDGSLGNVPDIEVGSGAEVLAAAGVAVASEPLDPLERKRGAPNCEACKRCSKHCRLAITRIMMRVTLRVKDATVLFT